MKRRPAAVLVALSVFGGASLAEDRWTELRGPTPAIAGKASFVRTESQLDRLESAVPPPTGGAP